MNVTYPLTEMSVEMAGSVPLTETWSAATPPTEPVTCTHDPTEPSMSATPEIMSSTTPTLSVPGPALAREPAT